MAAHLVGPAAHRTLQQPADALLEDRIDWQPDRVLVALGFQQFVDLGIGEGSITPEVAALAAGEPSEGLQGSASMRVQVEAHAALCADAAPVAGKERAAEEV